MRTFVAVDVSDEIKNKIRELQKELPKEGLRFVDPSIMHITLKFLGEIDEATAEKVKEEIALIRFEPFSVKIMGAGVFPNEKFIRVVWIGVESKELIDIAKLLNQKLEMLGFKPEKFTIHLTIARATKKIDLRNFLEKYKEHEFGEFVVDKIRLKKSTLLPAGPIYMDL